MATGSGEMLNRKRKKRGIILGHKSTFAGDECVHYLDSGHGFTGAYIWQNLSNYTF